MWHEQSVRNELEPSKSEGRVLQGRQFFQDFCHVKQDLSLRLRVETVADVYSCEDVNQQSVVGLLVKAALTLGVVLLQLGLDVDKDLVHEFGFVELKRFQQQNNQLYERIDEGVVQKAIVVPQILVLNLLTVA